MRRYPTGTTPHTHDKVYGFGHKKAPPRSLTLSPPYTENLIGTHHLHDEQHGNLRRAYGMSFNLYLKVTKHGNLQQRIRSFWRCPPQNDRGQCLFLVPGLGWNIRGASQENGGAVAVRRSRPRKSLPTRREVQEAKSSAKPNEIEQYQPVDYLPERG